MPHRIQEHIDYVEPGIRLPVSRAQHPLLTKRDDILIHGASGQMHLPDLDGSGTVTSLECDKLITPECIRALYKIPPATKSNPLNPLGIFQENNHFHPEDLDLFFENQTANIPQGTRPIDAVIPTTDGSETPLTFGLESALDLQVAYPIVYPQTITVYQANDHLDDKDLSQGFLDAFLNAIDGVSSVRLNCYCLALMILQSYCTSCALGKCDDGKMANTHSPSESDNQARCGIYKPANVISISYGGPEHYFPVAYQRRQCNECVMSFKS